MAVAIILKLIHGADTLNVNSGRYCVDDATFSPPSTARAVMFGPATVGSDQVAHKRANRNWSFNLTIEASSKSEAERALRNLQSFLNRAGGATPLYVAYRSWDDYDFEPVFGLHGAFSRYEIVFAKAEAGGGYNPTVGNSSKIVNVRVDLVIKPQSIGLQQQAGQATGFVWEDYIVAGVPGLPKGTAIGAAVTNECTNPVFMHSTYNTGWTASTATIDVAVNKDPKFVLFGDTSARLIKTGNGSGNRFTQSLTLPARTHTLSYYAKAEDGSQPTTRFWYNGSTVVVVDTVSLGDGWYRLSASVEGTAGAADTGVEMLQNIPTYIDGFQVEESAFTNHMVWGDWQGCTWAGTKNNSAATSTAGRVRYAFRDLFPARNPWTARIIWAPGAEGNISSNRFLADDSNNDIRVYIDTSGQVVAQVASGGSTVTSSALTLADNTAICLHIAYNGSTLDIYNAGSSVGTGGSLTAANADPTWVYVGSTSTPDTHAGGTFLGVAVYPEYMSAAEVLADYNQVAQQMADLDRIDPLPYVWSEDGDSILDNDNDGALANYGIVGGLMGDDVDVSYKLDINHHFGLAEGITIGGLPIDQRLFDKDILTDGGTNTLLFLDGNDGTADGDANGNFVERLTSLTNVKQKVTGTALSTLAQKITRGQPSIIGYFVAKDTSTNTNVQVRTRLRRGGNPDNDIITDWRTLSTSAAFRPFVTPGLPLDMGDEILNSEMQISLQLEFQRTEASPEHFDISHVIWLFNYSAFYAGDVGTTTSIDLVYVRGRVAEFAASSDDETTTYGRRILNRPIDITPDRLNVIMLQNTFDNYAASISTWTTGYNMEIDQFAVTPRFDIY